MATFVQLQLNRFHHARKAVVTCLAYITLRAYGVEVSYAEVKSGTFANKKQTPLLLEDIGDLDELLALSEEGQANAEKRRGIVTEKCKTLLTLAPLLLGVVGLLLPKYLAFDSLWMRCLSVCAIAVLFDAIVILLMYFDIGQDMEVSLTQDDIRSDKDSLKKSLLKCRLDCRNATENRTNYLVDLYRVARFCFLTALTIVAGLALTTLMISSPADQSERVVRELRSDPNLTNLLRGPKGDHGLKGEKGDEGVRGSKGEKGDQGERGDNAKMDDVLNRLFSDPRLKEAVEKAMPKQTKNSTSQP